MHWFGHFGHTDTSYIKAFTNTDININRTCQIAASLIYYYYLWFYNSLYINVLNVKEYLNNGYG